MHAFNLDRFSEALQSHHIQAALLSNPATLTWLTGYAPPIQTGPNPFEGGPALAWWYGGELQFILSNAEAGAASACGAPTFDYLSYSIEEPMQAALRQAAVLRKVLDRHASLEGNVGVELNFLPASFRPVVEEALPAAAGRRIRSAPGS
jgi:Xaa-Pro dipeptidase